MRGGERGVRNLFIPQSNLMEAIGDLMLRKSQICGGQNTADCVRKGFRRK